MQKNIKLSVQNVIHSYIDTNGEWTPALDNVSLDIREGEFVAIVGSSGCGKSTLLNIMCGLLAPTDGQVLLDGKNPMAGGNKIGYISQMDTLLPWRKVVDNVALGLEIAGMPKAQRRQTAHSLIEASGLGGFETKYPFELSGGMRKRVQIIRAIAQKPDIIFMDEPFGPLDVFTKQVLQQEILQLWRQYQNTIVYITHDIAEAISLADRIILLSYRPATIMNIYEVELPRPRVIEECKYLPYFTNLEKEIWDKIKGEVQIA